SLSHRLIHHFQYIRTHIHLVQLSVFTRWIDAVGQENIYQLVVGINPGVGTGKTGMTETGGWRTGCGIPVGIPWLGGTIKTYGPEVLRAKLTAAVLTYCIAGNIFPAAIFAVI